MALPRQATLRATRRLFRQPQRRSASHHSHGHDDSAKEAIGPGFMATVAVIPASYLLYLSANSDDSTDEPWFTRVLHKLDYWQDEFRDRNDLHTRLADQAASDRVLFLNNGTPPEKRLVDVRNNEVFNAGSPYNIPAGWGAINLDKVISHYQQQNAEQDQRTLEKLKARLLEGSRK